MSRRSRELVEVEATQLEGVLRRAEQSLAPDDFELTRAIFESYAYLAGLVEDKNTSIGRLRQLLFGRRSEKTDSVMENASEADGEPNRGADDQEDAGNELAEGRSSPSPSKGSPRAKGHGRHGADAYRGGERIEVPLVSLAAGDPCPACQQGTLYDYPPGVLVRIVGQAPLHSRVYELQRLRCHVCGKLFTAAPPEEAGTQKYDATAASMIALLKYGSGLPFNRMEGLQRNLGIPLPASTQWDVVHAHASALMPAYGELMHQAAQGEVVYNDDTTAKILEMMNARPEPSSEASEAARSRTGLFTSGVVATRGGQRVALFFSGRQHAGENLADVLKHRAAELTRPIQMCDALSRNLPGDLETIVAHCLAHARRQFVDLVDRFPEECRYVLEAMKAIYHHDAIAREENLSAEARLAFHQAESGPVMEELHAWLARQFEDRLVEPNSALGKAITYLQKHWERLTLFLRQPGAPLDNNLCERALKKAILHRKNALFYKTCHGAHVGDVFMSLIHTCELCGANPFDYLTELAHHAEELALAPHRWMPWNYRAACGPDSQ